MSSPMSSLEVENIPLNPKVQNAYIFTSSNSFTRHLNFNKIIRINDILNKHNLSFNITHKMHNPDCREFLFP